MFFSWLNNFRASDIRSADQDKTPIHRLEIFALGGGRHGQHLFLVGPGIDLLENFRSWVFFPESRNPNPKISEKTLEVQGLHEPPSLNEGLIIIQKEATIF